MDQKRFHLLSRDNSILLNYLAQIRDKTIQQDRLRFRTNILRMSRIMAYEVSKGLVYEEATVDTVLGTKSTSLLKSQPVLVSVMRAALPMFEGFLEIFDEADSAFIGAARSTYDEHNNFEINLSYTAAPSIEGRTLIVCDPMLASGKSIVKAVETLKAYGAYASLHLVALIASQDGIEYVTRELPNTTLWVADLDPQLNDKSYIVPGLGDAGDLAFGPKM